MLPPATQPPVERFGQPQIQLLPSDDPLYLEYGQASHVKLQPCKTAVERSSCGAVAIDVVDSEVADDLTPYITVTAGQACGLDGMLGEKVSHGIRHLCVCWQLACTLYRFQQTRMNHCQ